MIPPIILPLIRRAILDFLDEIGGDQNDDVVTQLLVSLGHSVARRDIREQLEWLQAQGLISGKVVGRFLVVEIEPDGIDVAKGTLKLDGISKHKTGR